MLASSLLRAARQTARPIAGVSLPFTPAAAASSNGLLATVARQAQRRYSSSKPPVPPSDGSKRIDASAPAKGVNPSGKASGDKREGKAAKRKGNGRQSAKSSQDAAFLNLPSVPSTQHLQPHDVHVASFFSIHRPISVTTSVPPPSTNEAFNALFSPKKQSKNEPEDVIYTLSSAIQTIENQQYVWSEQDGAFSHAEPEVVHLDGVPAQDLRLSIEEFVKRLRPFHPPPPPVPFEHVESLRQQKDETTASSKPTSSRSFSTVLTIRESTHADGRKTYEAHVSPFVRTHIEGDMEAPSSGVSGHEEAVTEEPQQEGPSGPSTYMERLRRNHIMHAISTRRRRKLKMKKHKYKKLLRKTRTLRRRLQ